MFVDSSSLWLQTENTALLQKKIGEMNAKCILLRQRKQAGEL